MQTPVIQYPVFITRDTVKALEREEGLPGIGEYYIEEYTKAGLWVVVDS